jgi:FkbM family methyltransferase
MIGRFNKKVKYIILESGLWNIAQKVYYNTLKRSELTVIQSEKEFYSKFIKPGNLCFDVGANVGAKTNIFLLIGARVVACEPQPYCIKVLEARFKKNPNFTLVPKGVGKEVETLPLYIHEENVGATSFISEWQKDTAKIEGKINVDMTTMDTLISIYEKPDYCKIDVEGFEINVLNGLKTSINLLSFEYHLDRGKHEIQKTIECLEYLSKLSSDKLYVNVIPGAGNIKFLRNQWFDMDEFINYFLCDLHNNVSFKYGDIFVSFNKR